MKEIISDIEEIKSYIKEITSDIEEIESHIEEINVYYLRFKNLDLECTHPLVPSF